MSDLKMRGIDLGNWRCHLMSGCFSNYFFDLIKHEVKNHMSQIKCLLGRKFSDPELQLELDYIPFRVIEGPNGCALVHSKCNGEDRAFTPVEILAMLLTSPYFSAITEYCDAPPCMGIPIYFTEQQKKDVFQAAKIAGLPASFCLLDETIAMVLALERDYNPKPKGIVAFVDIGHASMQVCFAEFKEDHPTGTRSINILYKGYARSLGGREFDKVLFKHFASKIKEEHDIDVSTSSSASIRLSEECERLKNDLSKKNEAPLYIEKLLDLVDVKGSITREKFETLSRSILKKIEVALKKALNESGLIVEKIGLIKLVGNGCSIPAIIAILTKIFGEKISKTISSDIVAKGCTMHATRQREENYGFWTERMTNDLETTGRETSEFVSEAEDSDQQFLWRRAMHKEGHLLTFLNDFLEKNMHRIRRSEKTELESYWLSKANYNFDEREMSSLQRERLKLNEQLVSERDDARKHLEAAQKVTEQLMSERDDARTLFEAAQKVKEQLMSERDDARALFEASQKVKEQLMSERDDMRALFEAAQKVREQLMSERDDARTLSEVAQKVKEQLMSERDDARKEVEELRQLTKLQNFTIYSNADLEVATNKFHETSILGKGGFGIVYKGNFNNTTVAIKMLEESKQGEKEFNQEIKIHSKVRHPNIVTLIGACVEKRAVIYEYLPNGSLQDRLRCENNTLPLPWQARIRIAFEICSAVSCLHSSKPHGIVHGDLKPGNILLDSRNVSKISDFGLCRELDSIDSASVPSHSTDVLKGTPCYIDPEYFSSAKITTQSDVYSFGIILLQLMTCKDPSEIRNLVEEAQKKGTLKIDASAGPWPFKLADKMISLGLRCSDPVRKNRPDLSTIVLKEIKSMLQDSA